MCIVCRRNALLTPASLALHSLYHCCKCLGLTSYNVVLVASTHCQQINPAIKQQLLDFNSNSTADGQGTQLLPVIAFKHICLLYEACNLSCSYATTGCRRPNHCSIGAGSCKKHLWILKGQEGSVDPSGAWSRAAQILLDLSHLAASSSITLL